MTGVQTCALPILVTEPVEEVSELTCPFVLMQRYRGEPDALPSPDFKLIASGNRPGDNAESFELYARSVTAGAPPAPAGAPRAPAGAPLPPAGAPLTVPVTEKAKTP